MNYETYASNENYAVVIIEPNEEFVDPNNGMSFPYGVLNTVTDRLEHLSFNLPSALSFMMGLNDGLIKAIAELEESARPAKDEEPEADNVVDINK